MKWRKSFRPMGAIFSQPRLIDKKWELVYIVMTGEQTERVQALFTQLCAENQPKKQSNSKV